jgi:dipeptidyl aminopeptidase/acylaminoacyl peptidase
MRSLHLLTALLVALTVSHAHGAPDAAPTPVRETVGNRSTEGIPPVPPELAARLARYQSTRGAAFAGWLSDGAMLVLTRFGNTQQAHRVRAPLGMREQLTFEAEPIYQAIATRGARNGFMYLRDTGGDEFWQIWWYSLATREPALLTDGKRTRNERPVLSSDGRWLAWSSTARNGTDSDIWLLDTASGERRRLTSESGSWYAWGFSPDAGRLLVGRWVSINEIYPGEIDLATGKREMFPVEGGKAAVTAFAYARDGRGAYFVSDEGSEFRTLRYHDFATNRIHPLTADIPWDIDALDLADDGRHLAFVANEGGLGRVHVLSLPDHRPVDLPQLPAGVVAGIGFDPQGRRLAVTLNSATAPSDVYVHDLGAGTLVRWTESEVGGLDPARFVAPALIDYPTFDSVDGAPRRIPAFYYRPRGAGPFPVVVRIHGGPESQELPVFNPLIQYLVNEEGIAVLMPNVRGSSGYGKTWLQLDNGMRRKDAVKDIGALLDWIARQPELDAKRVGLQGQSYGGYMVLASLVDYPERIRAAIELYGISHYTSFLQNTEVYRRDQRRAEYGDERDPAMHAFFERIAPLNNAQRIRSALFVGQGANDPRVRPSESAQIVRAVRANGREVWYLEFADEGHGFLKKSNMDYFYAASVMFWRQHL